MNLETAVLDVRRMAEADRLTVLAGIPVSALMENAGWAVVHETQKRWSIRPAVVLCGPGNNGGDGFAVARRLRETGWPVRVGLICPLGQLMGEARLSAQGWSGGIEPLTPDILGKAELVVDAVFGSGLTHAVEGAAADTLAAASQRKIPIVAVDVPSGLLGDRGESLGAVPAALTVTFFRKKPAHLLFPGRGFCGEVVVADIGTPLSVLETLVPDTFENSPCLWGADLPLPRQDGNKYTRGHALISGGYPITGAARMAGRAAARAGAGLTTIAVSECAFPIYAASLESVMVYLLNGPDDFVRMLQDRRYTAFLIGPGSGIGEETRSRVTALLSTGRATVLDADALTSFQDNPHALDQAIQGPCVLTPHEGEFARLFDPEGDKLARARKAAQRCAAILVLKGADTVIASPDGRAVINSNAPPTLASAGSGDVLSGIILGLLAQGMEPFLASAAAVWLHGEAARGFGPGLLAEDLPDLLPGLYRRLQSPDWKN
jgi:NAD(P)H-hydrate epimerase